MKKFKVTQKNGELLVVGKLIDKETFNQREVELLAQKMIRGILRPREFDSTKKKISLYGPSGVPLNKYIKSGMSEDNFYMIIAQVLEMVKKLQNNKLFLKNLIIDTKYIFINSTTREVNFIYQPVINSTNTVSIIDLMKNIVFDSVFDKNSDNTYVERFIQYLKSLTAFSIPEFEGYIQKNYPSVFRQLAKSRTGGSGFITNDKVEYQHHYEERKNTDNNDGTTLLVQDSEGTTFLEDNGSGATTLLVEEPEPIKVAYAFLTRVKNNEKIEVDKPVFRIGKERSYVDYFVSDNNAVSRSHADIIVKGNDFYILDHNSTNKTYLNDEIIKPKIEIKLENNMKIRLGNEVFIFHID